MKVRLAALTVLVLSLVALRASAQDSNIHESGSSYTVAAEQRTVQRGQRIQKRYNFFFAVNRATIDSTFKDNGKTLRQMREDITNTLKVKGSTPDSLLILSTASPDGRYSWNQRLAQMRSEKTTILLLNMFPEFKDSHIKVEYLDEDWSGLRQVLKANPDFPQRDQMLAIIDSNLKGDVKKAKLKQCTKGWRHLVDKYIHVLRNSSVTLIVIGAPDEYATAEQPDTLVEPVAPVKIDSIAPIVYNPKFEYLLTGDVITRPRDPMKYRKTHFAARTNLLTPGLSIGLEFPIHEHWSFGINYNYPWAVSAKNRWCTELLSLFVDTKYWITPGTTAWRPDSKLKGHGVGLYAGVGYYDFQNKVRGAQGEFVDFGVDYVYALPIANDKLRLEFNLGIGLIRTWYRPYNPSSDYEDLIKEPGVKYRSTDFTGPTRAGVSLVYPITTTVKKNPYIKMAKRQQRKAKRKAGGKND